MTIRAVLFDVGGPLATEIEHERAIDADIRSSFPAVADAEATDVPGLRAAIFALLADSPGSG